MSDEREDPRGPARADDDAAPGGRRAPSRSRRSHESDHVLTKSDLATVEALRPGTALLVVLRGPNTGARFLLDDDEVMSGRHPESDIFLDDVTVSRKHAVFRRTESGFVVRDVGSLNGTYVNRELVDEVVAARPATRCRSASSGSSSTRARPAPRHVTAEAPARRLTVGAVVRAAERGLPRRHDLQGALPGGRGAGHAHPHRVRLPRSSAPTTSSGCATCCAPSATCSGRCKVIKDNLEAIDRGLDPRRRRRRRARSAPAPVPDPDVPDAADLAARARPAAHRGRAGPGHRAGAGGGRRPRGSRPAAARRRPGCTTRPTSQVAHAAAGLGAYGVEPRHLRGFRAAADREVGLVEQVLGPRRGADAQRARRRGGPPVPRPARRPGPWWAVRPRGLTRGCRRAGYGDAMKVLDVLGVRVEMPTNQPIVLLRERDGDRYLPIWIGAAEATAIAYAQQGVVPPRPLTHDLLRNVIDELGHELTRGAHRRAQGRRLPRDARPRRGSGGRRHRDRVALLRRDRPGAARRCRDRRRGGRSSTRPGVEMAETEDDEVEKFKEFLDHVSADDFDTEADSRRARPGAATRR